MDPHPDVSHHRSGIESMVDETRGPVIDRIAASVEGFAGDAWWAGPVFEGLDAGAMVTVAHGNRWNLPGEPTVYLAGDLPVALVEAGRHRAPDDLTPLGIWRVRVRFARVLDLRRGDVREAIAAPEPTWFLDRTRTIAVASGIRALGVCDAIVVPSAGMPDHVTRANIVVLLPATQAAPSWLESSRLEMVLRPERTLSDLAGPMPISLAPVLPLAPVQREEPVPTPPRARVPRALTNRMAPQPSAPPAEPDAAAQHRRDIVVRDAVQRRLDASPDADLKTVGVGVEDGIVTLVGTVGSREMRAVAREIAREAAGVRRVVDLMLVGGVHAAIEQTTAVDASSRRGSSRGASPQEAGLVPSADDPTGPWTRGVDSDAMGSDL